MLSASTADTASAQSTIFTWNGNNDYSPPFDSSPAGGSLNGNATGVSNTSVGDAQGQYYYASGWSGGSNIKWWTTSFPTTGYAGIKVSSKQNSTNLGFAGWSGPKDFKLQYSLDNSSWVDVTNITVSNDWSTGSISNVSLPSACDNQPILYVRWLMSTNNAVGGGTVGSSAQSYIDDIIIKGTAAAPSNTAPSINNQTFSVDEYAPNGTIVDTVAASDVDGNTLSYSITGGNTSSAFSINGSTGAITVANRTALMYAVNPSFALTVQVNDGTDSSSATVTVNVNINYAPVLTKSHNISLGEDEQVFIGSTMNAGMFQDPEGANAAAFKFTQLTSIGSLSINGIAVVVNQEYPASDMGSVKYTPMVNFYGQDQAVLNFSDGVHYADTAMTIDLQIASGNDAPTAISIDNHVIAEDAAAGSVVGTLSALDVDINENHVYQIIDSNYMFVISGDQVIVNQDLDHETMPSLDLTIQVTDAAGDSFQQVFSFQITDVNEAPYNVALSSNTVSEAVTIGNTISIVSSMDEDFNDSHTYSLVAGAGDADNTAFAISQDMLISNTSFDYNTQQEYFIRIASTDAGGLSVEKAFVIMVTDANSAPTAIALSNNGVLENAAIGTVIGSFSSVDADILDTHTYTLVNGSGAYNNGDFNINQGNLETATAFDYENAPQFISIRVRSTDATGNWTEETFNISILDVNEPTSGVSLNSTSINENEAIGAVVGILSAIDPDQHDVITYSLVSGQGSSGNTAFAISGDQLVSNKVFDYEMQTAYDVRIRATDAAGHATEQSFTINVVDMNDKPVLMALTALAIDENSPMGATVAFMSTVDTDPSDTHTYSLVAGAGDADNNAFDIISNKLIVHAAYNYELKDSYSLRLRSTDNAGGYIEEAYNISINDLNEAPTAISEQLTALAENMPAGTVAATLGTSDEDRNDSHVYTLVQGQGDADNASFDVTGNELVTKASLNYEVQSVYSVRVQTEDLGGLTTEKVITITISDKNDPITAADMTKTLTSANQRAIFGNREFMNAVSDEDGGMVNLVHIKIGSIPANGKIYLKGIHNLYPGMLISIQDLSYISYVPYDGFYGTDSFTWYPYDGTQYADAPGTCYINITGGPRPGGTAVTTVSGTLLNNPALNNGSGNFRLHGEGSTTGVADAAAAQIEISEAWPNPFAGQVNFKITTPEAATVNIIVSDISGRTVKVINEAGVTGQFIKTLDTEGLGTGQYIYKVAVTGNTGELLGTKTGKVVKL